MGYLLLLSMSFGTLLWIIFSTSLFIGIMKAIDTYPIVEKIFTIIILTILSPLWLPFRLYKEYKNWRKS